MTQQNPYGPPALHPAGLVSSVAVGYQAPSAFAPKYQPWESQWQGAPVRPAAEGMAPSRRGGRAPAIVLATVIALLASAVFAVGVLSHHTGPATTSAPHRVAAAKPAVVTVPKTPAATPVPAQPKAAKPPAKPAAPRSRTTWVDVTPKNGGTLAAPYHIALPTGYSVNRGGNSGSKNVHVDVVLESGAFEGGLIIESIKAPALPDGALSDEALDGMRARIPRAFKGAKALAGTSVATVAGVHATGFDFTMRLPDGSLGRVRFILFAHDGALLLVGWEAPIATFASTLPQFQHLVATLTFGRSSTAPGAEST
ncbi:MAG: hypothetical protein ABI912_03870 [Actinomycetota bacterium]